MLASRIGTILLRGAIGPNLAARAVTQTASADGAAIALGSNFTGPVHAGQERGRFETAPAEPAGAPSGRGPR